MKPMILVIKDTPKGIREIPITSMAEARRLVSGMSASGVGIVKDEFNGVARERTVDQSQVFNCRSKQSPKSPEGL
jgi:hypothetical protein